MGLCGGFGFSAIRALRRTSLRVHSLWPPAATLERAGVSTRVGRALKARLSVLRETARLQKRMQTVRLKVPQRVFCSALASMFGQPTPRRSRRRQPFTSLGPSQTQSQRSVPVSVHPSLRLGIPELVCILMATFRAQTEHADLPDPAPAPKLSSRVTSRPPACHKWRTPADASTASDDEKRCSRTGTPTTRSMRRATRRACRPHSAAPVAAAADLVLG